MNGTELKQRRLALDMTQVELAAQLGMTGQAISDLENERYQPQNATLLDLALRYLELKANEPPDLREMNAQIEVAIAEQRAKLDASRRRVRRPATNPAGLDIVTLPALATAPRRKHYEIRTKDGSKSQVVFASTSAQVRRWAASAWGSQQGTVVTSRPDLN